MSEVITLFEHKNKDPNIVRAPEYKITSVYGGIWTHGHFYDEDGQKFHFTIFGHDISTMTIHLPSVESGEEKCMYMSLIHLEMMSELIKTITAKMKEFMSEDKA